MEKNGDNKIGWPREQRERGLTRVKENKTVLDTIWEGGETEWTYYEKKSNFKDSSWGHNGKIKKWLNMVDKGLSNGNCLPVADVFVNMAGSIMWLLAKLH